jgi:UDP-N-acetylmuramoylalanine--D-glutamate ligase
MTFSVRGQNVTVVGAARSGVAAAMLLADRGAHVTVTDLQPALEPAVTETLRAAGVDLALGDPHAETLTTADLIVVSPGVRLNQPSISAARAAGVPVMGEIELASRWLSGRIVAITGTKGKSTTTTLTGRMFDAGGLRALVGGNIGTPLSSQVAASTPETFHIVEVSSFQLETTQTFHPWIAVLLNLSSDHLDRHGSMEEYAAAKARIFANQTPEDWAVINADDPQTLALARACRAQKVTFSVDAPLVPLSSIRLIGRHLVADVMAAATVARIAGVPHEAMVKAVESFEGLEHALEPVAVVDGVRFINDSKATNVEAAKLAIEAFAPGLVVIMGGRYKSGEFSLLGEPLRARNAQVVAIGEAAPLIHEALDAVVAVYDADSMRAAVRRSFELAKQERAAVLLAPACASFDMFRDYADRGRAFKEEVSRLGRATERSDRRGAQGSPRAQRPERGGGS